MLFEVKDVDRRVYNEYLVDWLPDKIFDIHTHLSLKASPRPASVQTRYPKWPRRVTEQNPVEDLLSTYELMFPHQEVTPLVFGSPGRGRGVEQSNSYVSQAAERCKLPGLLLSRPEWAAEELERRVTEGGFLGLKPYLNYAPAHIASEDITIFDFLPRHHLEVANARGWIVMLHIPRPARLRDPTNLEQMLEIEHKYPDVRLIIAHIGRAYCAEDIGNAFEVLQDTKNMLFDFSANTNSQAMEQLLRTVGARRVLFGSDMPILRMRMRRICEEGFYINLVPPGLYGDLTGEPHMREVSPEEGEKLTFFMYEELLAFQRAAAAAQLSSADLQDVFYNNAAYLIESAGVNL